MWKRECKGTLRKPSVFRPRKWVGFLRTTLIRKLCQAYRKQYGDDFISAMPANLYGPRDNFDLETSHVIPALIRKAHEAKIRGASEMTIWGTGEPRRAFLRVDDRADALVYLMKRYAASGHVNVGSGADVTIRQLAETIRGAVGFDGKITTDVSKPDGRPRKLMSSTTLGDMGWQSRIGLESGISSTYRWFLENAT